MSLTYLDANRQEVIYSDGHRKYRVMKAETALRESGLRLVTYNSLKDPLEEYLEQQAKRQIRTCLIGSVLEGGSDEDSDIDIRVGLDVQRKEELTIWYKLMNLNTQNPMQLLGIDHAPYKLHFHSET